MTLCLCCRGVDEARYAVSCLNTVKTDWKEGVQLWTCPQDINPLQVQYTRVITHGGGSHEPGHSNH
jgi:hypothetical protein